MALRHKHVLNFLRMNKNFGIPLKRGGITYLLKLLCPTTCQYLYYKSISLNKE